MIALKIVISKMVGKKREKKDGSKTVRNNERKILKEKNDVER